MQPPTFCPNKHCKHYRQYSASPGSPWYEVGHGLVSGAEAKPIFQTGSPWYRKRGTYVTACHGRVQRYECRDCGSSFSTQTYLLDIGVKKRVSYRRILVHLVSGSGIRDIGRDLGVGTGTVLNRISRLARQCVAVHGELSMGARVGESWVSDGIESYAVSQYFPNNIQVLVGKESQYWVSSEYAHLRRKGRMRAEQRQRREEVEERFVSGRVTIAQAFERVVQRLQALGGESLQEPRVLYTDEHPQYRKVMNSLGGKAGVEHRRCSSKGCRTVQHRLFAVNYLDREIRKDCGEHVRETVKFARNVSNSMERLAVYRFYHNYLKSYRIGKREYRGVSHAEVAGIPRGRIRKELGTVFWQRRFLFRSEGISWGEAMVWLRGIVTPLKKYAEVVPGYAWQ